MISNARQVSYSSASDKNGAVFLQVVVYAGDISGNFFAVCKSYTRDFAQRRVRLFGRLGSDYQAHPAFLRRT
jgi:hypothetical protein